MDTSTLTHQTPLGPLALTASERGLTRCVFRAGETREAPSGEARRHLALAQRELDAYFAGESRTFSVPVDLERVTGQRRRILDAVRAVEYGETVTYGELSRRLGLDPVDGPRQVGGAMASNPVLIVVPCHRVVGADGKLVGYAGGLAAKRGLLELERTPALW